MTISGDMQQTTIQAVPESSAAPAAGEWPAGFPPQQQARRGAGRRVLLAALALMLALGGCADLNRWRADWHYEQANDSLQRDDIDAALAELQRAVELDPSLAVAYSNIGLIYRRRGEYDKAIENFVEAVRYNPTSFDDTSHLAQLYQFTHRLKDAIRAYLHAIDLRPQDFDANLNLGVCYQRKGDYPQAVKQFEQAIELDANRPHAYVNLGVALASQGKYYEAVRAYKEALERDNHQPEVLVNLAHAYIKQDRLKIGRETLRQAILLDPEFAAAHEAMGYCQYLLKDYEKAEVSYKQALACDSQRARAQAGLGSVYMLKYLSDRSRPALRDQALEHWHRSLELDSDQDRIRKLIAHYKPRYEDPTNVLLGDQGGE